MDGAANEATELHVKRQIEAQIGTQASALFLRGILPDHESYGVTGEIEQAEGDEGDHQHHGEGLRNAADDEGEHAG